MQIHYAASTESGQGQTRSSSATLDGLHKTISDWKQRQYEDCGKRYQERRKGSTEYPEQKAAQRKAYGDLILQREGRAVREYVAGLEGEERVARDRDLAATRKQRSRLTAKGLTGAALNEAMAAWERKRAAKSGSPVRPAPAPAVGQDELNDVELRELEAVVAALNA